MKTTCYTQAGSTATHFHSFSEDRCRLLVYSLYHWKWRDSSTTL